MGVGIGVPGLVDPDRGRVAVAPNLPALNERELGPDLGRVLGRPVRVENDVNAIAVGEWRKGAGRGARALLVVTLGTGVGGGLILAGTLYRGPDGTAGEVGHMPLRPGGPRCRCGARGCLEVYASATAVVAAARAAGVPTEGGAAAVAVAARAGDPRARKVFARAGAAVGVAAAGLVNLLNLDRMVIGGGLAGAWDLMEPHARRELGRRAFSRPLERFRWAPSLLGDDAGVVGAAILAKENMGA
ncbi:MAG: ROK family protein [Candidatus Dadabacteria bacterium]|nr:MAG: ROK family protein [Candidatus Dadabacteria bacterium]